MHMPHSHSINMLIHFTFTILLINSAGGYPATNTADPRLETNAENPSNNEGNSKNVINCKGEEFSLEDVIFLNDSDIFLKTKNITVHYFDYRKEDGKVIACLDSHDKSKNKLITECKEKFRYDAHEFEVFPNLSVLSHDYLYLPGEYDLKKGKLFVCAPDYDYDDDGNANNFTSSGLTLGEVSIYVGKIGSGISIVALAIHLLIFCCVPALQNLPGCNLASLSVAFLFAYSFVIIGQIPEVLGVSCVISGVLQQNFFLVAFFWMNVLAFDVWRTLKLATEKLILGSSNVRKRQFLWYSLYAWGFPLVISSVSVIVDNIDGVPEKIKPYFGRDDYCWMTNKDAKTIFFVAPAFTLFVINALFFILSAIMISKNTMKSTNEQHKQSVKFNYFLYLRLGLMMGLTWLIGVVALLCQDRIVWFIHDLLNSLQGLFLFLLFTCTKKVLKHLKERVNHYVSTSSSSEKQSTCSSKMDSHQV